MFTSRGATQSVSAVAVQAARLSIGSGALFALVLASLHVLEPQYDPTWRFVSQYQLGAYGWMMHFAFVALALSMASLAVAVTSWVRVWYGYIGLAILWIAAVGILIAGIFPTGPAIASRRSGGTFRGRMHVLGASLDYTPVAAVLLSLALVRNDLRRAVRTRLFITASLAIIVMLAFVAALVYDRNVGPGNVAGLLGRLLLMSYLGWLATVALHLLALRRRATHGDSMSMSPHSEPSS